MMGNDVLPIADSLSIMKTIPSGCVFLACNRYVESRVRSQDAFYRALRAQLNVYLFLGENWCKTTKKPTLLIGSFVLSLAVPMGVEPAMHSIRIAKDDIVEICCICHKISMDCRL